MKIAICGAWHVHVADYARHAAQLGQIVGIYEENDALRQAFLKTFDVPVFDTLDALLESDAEGVIICSATNAHTRHMVRIAQAGKHIFTEKVLALTSEECRQVRQAVEANGVRFVISLPWKTFATCRAVERIARSGELGKLNYMRFRNCHSGSVANWLPTHFYNREECGGGAMIDLGAHGMYLTDWILGMPEAGTSVFTRACSNAAANEKNSDGVEDNALTVFRYADGTIAVNETGFVSSCSPVTLEVFGEQGYVRMVGDQVLKCTVDTERREQEVQLGEALPLHIVQFLTGQISEGFGITEAEHLTALMEEAYTNIR